MWLSFVSVALLGGVWRSVALLPVLQKFPNYSFPSTHHLTSSRKHSSLFLLRLGIESIGDIGTIDRCPVADRLKQPVGVLE